MLHLKMYLHGKALKFFVFFIFQTNFHFWLKKASHVSIYITQCVLLEGLTRTSSHQDQSFVFLSGKPDFCPLPSSQTVHAQESTF